MSEYSTVEHFYQIHDNHSEHFSLKSNDDYGGPIYKHVEYLKTSSAMVSFVVGNTTDVNCSPKFSLRKLINERVGFFFKRDFFFFLIINAKYVD